MQFCGHTAALKNIPYLDNTVDSLNNWKTWKILTYNTMVIWHDKSWRNNLWEMYTITKWSIYFHDLTWFHVSKLNAADATTWSLDMPNTVNFGWKKLLKKVVLGFKLLLTGLLPATLSLAELPNHKNVYTRLTFCNITLKCNFLLHYWRQRKKFFIGHRMKVLVLA
jgi:hypothetical protein